MLGLLLVAASRLPQHTAALPISPDASLYARWASPSPDLELVDARTGAVRRRLGGGRAAPSVVLFSPDGRSVAAWSTFGELRLWSVETGRLLAYALDADARGATLWASLAFSPDGRTLAVANLASQPRSESDPTTRSLTLFDARSGERRLEARLTSAEDVRELRFARGGRAVRAAGSSVVDVDARSGRIVGEPLPIRADALSADGRLAAVLSFGEDAWDVDARRRLWRVPAQGLPSARGAFSTSQAAFSPDGRTLALDRRRNETNGDMGYAVGTTQIRRTADGALLWTGPEVFGAGLPTFSPDGARVLLRNGELRDAATGRVERTFGTGERPILGRKGSVLLLPKE